MNGNNRLRHGCILIALTAFSFHSKVFSNNLTFACQFTNAAGMKWEGRQWKTRSFILKDPFFIAIMKNQIDKKSIAPLLGAIDIDYIDCHTHVGDGGISCSTKGVFMMGDFFIFNPRTNMGSVASTIGSTMASESYRDSVSINIFKCQRI